MWQRARWWETYRHRRRHRCCRRPRRCPPRAACCCTSPWPAHPPPPHRHPCLHRHVHPTHMNYTKLLQKYVAHHHCLQARSHQIIWLSSHGRTFTGKLTPPHPPHPKRLPSPPAAVVVHLQNAKWMSHPIRTRHATHRRLDVASRVRTRHATRRINSAMCYMCTSAMFLPDPQPSHPPHSTALCVCAHTYGTTETGMRTFLSSANAFPIQFKSRGE